MTQQQTILRMSELPAILGISTATINRLRAAGKFVKPIRLGEQAIGFKKSEIDEWVENRPLVRYYTESLEP